jgi:hypothetical protein
VQGEKQGRLQHRLQLGIPPSCEVARTVDQVPILGKWSHKLKTTAKFKEKDRREEKLRFVLQKFFRTQILFPDMAEVTLATFPFSLLTLGML